MIASSRAWDLRRCGSNDHAETLIVACVALFANEIGTRGVIDFVGSAPRSADSA